MVRLCGCELRKVSIQAQFSEALPGGRPESSVTLLTLLDRSSNPTTNAPANERGQGWTV